MLEQNDDIKLLIIGGHAVPELGSNANADCNLYSIGNDVVVKAEDRNYTNESEWCQERAQTIENKYWEGDRENVSSVSAKDIGSPLPNVTLPKWNEDPVGIRITFDLRKVPELNKKEKNNPSERNIPHSNPRFL
jgi:hypothetical protein